MNDTDNELEEIFKYFRTSPLAGHAQAIGYLCIIWSWLEMSVNALLCTLTAMDPDKAAAAVVNNMGFRDQLRALLALGFVRKISDGWYEDLETVTLHIDNDLRPERNRMVHDTWHPGEDDVLRMTHHAKVVREQARKLALQFGTGKMVSVTDIHTLTIRVLAAQSKILKCLGDYDRAQTPSPDTDA